MDFYKLNHRQSETKMAVHISAVLYSFTSPGMSDLNFCLFEQENLFHKTGFFPLRLSMQLLSKKSSPDFQSELHHIIHEIVI